MLPVSLCRSPTVAAHAHNDNPGGRYPVRTNGDKGSYHAGSSWIAMRRFWSAQPAPGTSSAASRSRCLMS